MKTVKKNPQLQAMLIALVVIGVSFTYMLVNYGFRPF